MNAHAETGLSTKAEGTIAAAVALISAGNSPEHVLRFVYSLAYMDGALNMAQATSVDSAMRSILTTREGETA